IYKGVSYIGASNILNNRILLKNKQFYIPLKFDEVFLMFLPFYLASGKLNKKYENIIIEVFQQNEKKFKEYFTRLDFDMDMTENFYKAILNKDYETLKKLSPDIKTKIFLNHFNTLNILAHYFMEVKLRMPFSNSYYVKVELKPENMKELYLSLDSFAKNIIFIELNNFFDYTKLCRIQTNFTMYVFYKKNNSMTVKRTLKQIISHLSLKKGK
ncbi:MAG: hypothetical protein KAI79_18230, partial [Bacteroidales bacterium]|nr:hypothetical protein [Bacteroidales bacterium]